MSRTKTELDERVDGAGDLVFRNDARFRVNYSLSVYQNMIESLPGSWVPTTKRIEGRTWSDDPRFGAMVGVKGTLHLSDGRRLDMFITDSSGSIANSGPGLYQDGDGKRLEP